MVSGAFELGGMNNSGNDAGTFLSNVRFGSKADMCSAQARCPLSANSGHRERHSLPNKKPSKRFCFESFPATPQIDLSDLLSLPTPAEQTKSAEAGGEKRKCGRKRRNRRVAI